MNQEQLQSIVSRVSIDYFGQDFQHIASFNKRLRTTGGRYLLETHNLEFNPKMTDLPEFEGIIKHELVHYHLHLRHMGYQHKDADFKKALRQVNGIRFAPRLAVSGSKTKHTWLYACDNGHQIIRHRRFNVDNYRCARCQTRVHLLGEASQV